MILSMLSGIVMMANCFLCYAYNYTAIVTTTRIIFASRRVNGYFALDNVFVRDYAALATELLGNENFETRGFNIMELW